MSNLMELLKQKSQAIEEIAAIEKSILSSLAPVKARLAEISKEIYAIATVQATRVFAEAKKKTGTCTMQIDGVEVKATIDKTVKWDQGKLAGIFDKIQKAGDDPRAYIEVKYGVKETAFRNWPDPVKAVFSPARDEKPGNLDFEFKIQEVKCAYCGHPPSQCICDIPF